MSRDADCDRNPHRAGAGRSGDTGDGNFRKLAGIEDGGAQHVLQRTRLGVVGNIGGEIRTFFAARLGVVHHEALGRQVQPKSGSAAGHLGRTLK